MDILTINTAKTFVRGGTLLTGSTRHRLSIGAMVGIVVAALLATTISFVQAGGNSNPGVIAPDDAKSQTGQTYGEWSATWWQWALAIPVPNNPLLDTTGQNCQVALLFVYDFVSG